MARQVSERRSAALFRGLFLCLSAAARRGLQPARHPHPRACDGVDHDRARSDDNRRRSGLSLPAHRDTRHRHARHDHPERQHRPPARAGLLSEGHRVRGAIRQSRGNIGDAQEHAHRPDSLQGDFAAVGVDRRPHHRDRMAADARLHPFHTDRLSADSAWVQVDISAQIPRPRARGGQRRETEPEPLFPRPGSRGALRVRALLHRFLDSRHASGHTHGHTGRDTLHDTLFPVCHADTCGDNMLHLLAGRPCRFPADAGQVRSGIRGEPMRVRLHHHSARHGPRDGHESGHHPALAVGLGQSVGHNRHDHRPARIGAHHDLLRTLHLRTRLCGDGRHARHLRRFRSGKDAVLIKT